MKKLIIIAIISFCCFSCNKNEFSIDDPDVKMFVELLKNGTYNEYELGDNGENLWPKMPNFGKEHVPLLIHLSQDTTLIYSYSHFPTNPVSSIPPYRINNGKECIMIGEFLLWCAEGVIEENVFASLVPIIINKSIGEENRLSGSEILEVRIIFQNWWNEYGKLGEYGIFPLDGTSYKWR